MSCDENGFCFIIIASIIRRRLFHNRSRANPVKSYPKSPTLGFGEFGLRLTCREAVGKFSDRTAPNEVGIHTWSIKDTSGDPYFLAGLTKTAE